MFLTVWKSYSWLANFTHAYNCFRKCAAFVTLKIIIISPKNLTHDLTAVLSGHMSNLVVIRYHFQIIPNMNFHNMEERHFQWDSPMPLWVLSGWQAWLPLPRSCDLDQVVCPVSVIIWPHDWHMEGIDVIYIIWRSYLRNLCVILVHKVWNTMQHKQIFCPQNLMNHEWKA